MPSLWVSVQYDGLLRCGRAKIRNISFLRKIDIKYLLAHQKCGINYQTDPHRACRLNQNLALKSSEQVRNAGSVGECAI
jgi:hypothetical protein